MEPVIALEGIVKQFGAVRALKGVDFALYPGEVHVLLGENGAGKSTLVNTILGTYTPDEGTVTIRGKTVPHHNPTIARASGINVVLQDFSLAPTLSVAENIFLGREPLRGGLVSQREMRGRTRGLLERLGGGIDPAAEAGSLARAEQQLVEIAKALVGNPGVMLLDEPTAAISDDESERLFTIVDSLREEGWAILYITHRMEEVRRLGNRVSVMRDGATVSSYMLDEVSDSRLLSDMVGRELNEVYPHKATEIGDTLIEIDGVASANSKVKGVSLTVRQGEIVGVAGLVGSGKSDLARMILGLEPTIEGSYTIAGTTVHKPAPRRMLDLGIGFMPEDRRREALSLQRSVAENITLEVVGTRAFSPLGFLRTGALATVAAGLVERTDVRPPIPEREVGMLSGGNQQKVVLARALTKERRVFVVAEPTAGVDVGSRQQIYGQLRDLCDQGAGVLAISSDLEEIIGIADRIYVMNSGVITAELVGPQITPEAIVAGAFGHSGAAEERENES
ncbi:MAG: sugar ABC transporter ATP-binding protein [Microbacterium sp.]|uniref:sugar ABC transporter ATP-binding protein n=1 Tax=Microbacterium sp. TaxID=51671 RepID=UPI0039E6864A